MEDVFPFMTCSKPLRRCFAHNLSVAAGKVFVFSSQTHSCVVFSQIPSARATGIHERGYKDTSADQIGMSGKKGGQS